MRRGANTGMGRRARWVSDCGDREVEGWEEEGNGKEGKYGPTECQVCPVVPCMLVIVIVL